MRIPLFICLALILVNAAIYTQVRKFDFVHYDDGAHVYENLPIQRGLSPDSMKWAFSSILISNYIPITTLTYLLDFQLHGLDPAAYHLTNLLLHAANSLLLFWVLFRLSSALWPSALVAALFAVHPLHVETVAWISARKDVVSTFFGLLAVWSYMAYVRRPRVLPYLASLISFTLGLLAKPMLVTLPFVLLLLDYWPLNRLGRHHEAPPVAFRERWGVLLEKVPFLLLSVLVSVLTLVAQRGAGAVQPASLLGFPVRVYNAVVSYAAYVGNTFWPSGLIPFYPHPGAGIPLWHVLLSLFFLAAVSALCFRLRRTRPYLIVGWLWFLGTLVPVIGLIQVGGQAMADRYTYIPLIGLFVMAAWALRDSVIAWPKSRTALTLSATAVVLILSLVSWRQTRHWENSIALFEHTLRFSPNNTVALGNLGAAYLDAGRPDEAIERIEAVLALYPRDVGNLRNLGKAYLHTGRLEEAEERLELAIALDRRSPKTLNLIGLVLLNQGKELQAQRRFEKALELEPEFLPAHNNLGNVLLQQGLHAEALAHYLFVLERNPRHPDALTNIGATLLYLKDYEGAIPVLKRSLEIAPDDAVTRVNLAVAYFELGRFEEARLEAERAREMDPTYEKADELLQLILSQSP
ncbi:MAG: tetratricopeptide repeat protein [Candidatus Hydrogenedentes bacterium]|nr:tetratricopeptide repeat protein [Candidatus Hydrogenedentota bacterium]